MLSFSFLLCVNNDNPFLKDAIYSMVHQDFEGKYDIIIIANNCSEELFDKLSVWSLSYENIILHRTNIGQLAFNLNYGLNLSSSDYICRMDADDLCEPSRLKDTLGLLERYEYPDLLSGSAYLINEKNEVIGRNIKSLNCAQVKRRLPFFNCLIHPATAIKRETILSARGYAGGINNEDYDLWTRLLRRRSKIIRDSTVLIRYRINTFQCRGSRIGYADGIGVRLREFLMTGRISWLVAVLARNSYFLFKLIFRRFN